jgi:GYF domain 2
MTYMIKRGGQEAGPFSLERLREMHEARQIDDETMFRPYGSDHWLAAVDIEDALTGNAPPAPVQAASRIHEHAALGFAKAAKVWALTLGGLFAFGLILKLLGLSGQPSPEISAAQEKREKERQEYRAEVSRVIQLGGDLGAKDGGAVGRAGDRKPSLNEISLLCAKRATENGIEKLNDEQMQSFATAYISAFKRSYKSTADW